MQETGRFNFVNLSFWPLRLVFSDFVLLLNLEVESEGFRVVASKLDHHGVGRPKSKLTRQRNVDCLVCRFLGSFYLFKSSLQLVVNEKCSVKAERQRYCRIVRINLPR